MSAPLEMPPVPPPTSVVVKVSSAWWSKINWTSVIGVVCTLLAIATSNKFAISSEMQLTIVAAIQAVQALVTVILKTYFTTTVTPGSLTPAIVLKSKMEGLR